MYQFYLDPSFRQRQAERSKNNWKKGLYALLVKPLELRQCKKRLRKNSFLVKPYDPKIFCSISCATSVNHKARVQSEKTRMKISLALQNHYSVYKRIEKVSRVLPYLEKEENSVALNVPCK